MNGKAVCECALESMIPATLILPKGVTRHPCHLCAATVLVCHSTLKLLEQHHVPVCNVCVSFLQILGYLRSDAYTMTAEQMAGYEELVRRHHASN